MNRQVCSYSIIRFQPFQETEEFANIGIVLYAHDSRVLRVKLLSSREHARITNFFEPLNKSIYSDTIKHLNEKFTKPQNTLEFFNELIRPRESIVRYSENRVLFSTNTAATLDELFSHYVKCNFARHENFELEMQKRIEALLQENSLNDRFKKASIGDKYKVKFPFFNEENNQAIKPIHFQHVDSNSLYEHGLLWLTKVKQLTRGNFIEPNNILFAYRAPNENQGVLFDAFSDIKEQIEEAGIVTANIEQPPEILRFLVC